MKTVNLEQGSPGWHTYRKTKIGASEVANLFNSSPFCNWADQELYLMGVKLGFIEVFQNQAMRDGNKAEAEIVEFVEGKYGVITQPLIGYEGNISASFDGIDMDWETIIEVKNSAVTHKYVLEHEKVPDHYLLQIQQQLLVSGAEIAYFGVRNPETKDIATLEVKRDPDLQAKITEMISDYFDRVNSKVWKDEDFSEDRTDKEWKEAVDEYKVLKEILENRKTLFDEAKEKLIELAGGVTTRGNGATVSKSKPRVTVNYKAIVTDNKLPIDGKYKKLGEPSWSVRMKG